MAQLTAHIHLDGNAIVVQALKEAMEMGKHIMIYLDDESLNVTIFDQRDEEDSDDRA